MTPMIVIDAVTVYVVASIFLIVLDQYNKKKPKYWHIVIDKYTDRPQNNDNMWSVFIYVTN